MQLLPVSSLQPLIPSSRLESDLILNCVRPHLDSAALERIQTLLQQPLDWDDLLQKVEKHRVLPLFYRHLSTCPDAVPPEVLWQMRSRFYENAIRNLLLTKELLDLLQLFAAQDIRAIPYKGTVLSASVYGKTSLRQVWDLDILVAESDVSRSKTLLLEQGYDPKDTNDREQSFFHAERNVEVDLHWGLTPYYFPIHLDFDRLWHNRQPVRISNTTIHSFAPEDLLVILCIQVAKDCWERRQHLEHLAKVCDIAALIQAYPMLNWQAVWQQAKDTGAERMVNFGLFLAQGLLEADLPPAQARLQADKTAAALAQQVCLGLFGAIDETFANSKNSYLDMSLRMNQLKFYLRMRERPDHKIQHVWEIMRTLTQVKLHG